MHKRIKRGRVILSCVFIILLPIMMGKDKIKIATVDPALEAQQGEVYGRLPLFFIQNNGQVDNSIRFYEKRGGHSTFFTREGVYLSLVKDQVEVEGKGQIKGSFPKPQTPNAKSEIVKLSFIESNRDPEIIAEGLQEGRANYFIDNDPAKWKTNIPTYKAVVYKEIYPGIDVKFYGNNRQLEYDIIIKPGADAAKVKLSYEGIEGLNITKEGDLEIDTLLKSPLNKGGERGVTSATSREGGKIIHKRPYIYQEIDGKRVEKAGRFKIQDAIARSDSDEAILEGGIVSPSVRNDKNTRSVIRNPQFIHGFDVASYDKRYPLIIDPVLVYSTYLGGNDSEKGFGIALDSSDNVYVIGVTSSFDFKTANPFQPSLGGDYDVFVAKLNPSGSALVYSTYLGGMRHDYGYAIAVDSSGSAYLTGTTYSFNFPTKNPLQSSLGGEKDVFVVKLDPKGSAIVYSTFLGGSNKDEGRAIAVDRLGSAYITGFAHSAFPTVNPLQKSYGGGYADAFVAKLNPEGSALVYSTFLGGSYQEFGYGIALDSSGNVYVTGGTRSPNFPIKNPFQPNFGGNYDAFVTKLNPEGSDLVYSTYLGRRRHDDGYGIAVDSSGSAYVAGRTASPDFPTLNPLQPALGSGNDAFVVKLNPKGSALVYSTFLGGSGGDFAFGITLDRSGNAYVTGVTSSKDFPIANSSKSGFSGMSDAFVAKLNPEGSAVYSAYLGGKDREEGSDIAVDRSGNAYVVGWTRSKDLQRIKPLQSSLKGKEDAFVVKIEDTPALTSKDR